MPNQRDVEVLTRKEAADAVQLNVSTIDRAIRSGALRACQPNGKGGAVRIVRRDLLRWFGLLLLLVAVLVGFVLPLRGCEARATRPTVSRTAVRIGRRRAVSGVSFGRRALRPSGRASRFPFLKTVAVQGFLSWKTGWGGPGGV